ncbi:hypothetical protein [uncultured Victivallis sp.]|uniref:hypothetical protein n=1 Tax=uncultured Victivallis sp. TaxID=354118 RepID=UPI00258DCC75|nr:hypothetical protein [uncultured Victivallis sp.]
MKRFNRVYKTGSFLLALPPEKAAEYLRQAADIPRNLRLVRFHGTVDDLEFRLKPPCNLTGTRMRNSARAEIQGRIVPAPGGCRVEYALQIPGLAWLVLFGLFGMLLALFIATLCFSPRHCPLWLTPGALLLLLPLFWFTLVKFAQNELPVIERAFYRLLLAAINETQEAI